MHMAGSRTHTGGLPYAHGQAAYAYGTAAVFARECAGFTRESHRFRTGNWPIRTGDLRVRMGSLPGSHGRAAVSNVKVLDPYERVCDKGTEPARSLNFGKVTGAHQEGRTCRNGPGS
jgi:hypothetical protein